MMKEILLRYKILTFFAICTFDALFLLYCAKDLSISYYEAMIFFEQNKFISWIVRASCAIFGQNDFALRAPMILFHLGSLFLLYKLSKFYLKHDIDRLLCVGLFMLLPGSLASALVVNNAGICVFLALLILYLFHKKQMTAFYIFFALSLLIDTDFLIFYIAFFIYAIYNRNAILAWVSAILLLATLGLFGFDTGGRPKGHFIDTFGIFAAVFSPFVFFFFIYTIYRIWVKERKEILWFVCVSAFCFCMVVSIRQRLELENFLPFCIIATPLMVRMFLNSYRVRLPQFRRPYKIAAALMSVFLGINWLIIVFNPMLYSFIDQPRKHFAYAFHIAKELADDINGSIYDTISIEDKKLALRLKFYGVKIDENSQYVLVNADGNFNIIKFGKAIAKFNIEDRKL